MSAVTMPAGTEGRRGQIPASPGTGDRLGSIALRLLLAVPVAAVVLVAWEFAMQTSAGYNESERVRGWEVVLRELPATVLLLAPVAAGLALGVRSAGSGSRKGVIAIRAHCAALFLLVLMVVGDTADSVSGAGVGWAAPLGAATVAAGVLLLCRGLARRPALPLGAHLRLGAGVAVAGVVLSFGWLFVAQGALSARAGGFPRSAVPGAVTVAVGHPGTYYIYAEGNAPDSLADLGVQVTDPAGGPVAVTPRSPNAEYLRKLRGGRAIGTFVAAQAGDYRVVATAAGLPAVNAPFAPANPNGDFAVGGSVDGWMRPQAWGAAILLVTAVASGAVLGRPRRSAGARRPTRPR